MTVEVAKPKAFLSDSLQVFAKTNGLSHKGNKLSSSKGARWFTVTGLILSVTLTRPQHPDPTGERTRGPHTEEGEEGGGGAEGAAEGGEQRKVRNSPLG